MSRIIKKYEITKSDTAAKIPDYIIDIDNDKTYEPVIYSDEFRQQAHEEAAKIIADAVEKSKQMINDAQKKADQIKSIAYEKGYSEGAQARNRLVTENIDSIHQAISEMKNDQDEYFDVYARELKGLSVDVAEKLICQKLEDDDKLLFSLVKRAIRSIRDAEWIKVEVSDKLKNSASQLEKELSDIKENQRVEVELRRNADKGTCVIHTAEGVIVASVLTQLQNIREYFSEYTDEDEEYDSDR